MKAVIIPTILAATVLVAAMFAFMPVQKASTVHTTILGQIEVTQAFLDVGTAAAGNTNALTVDFIVVDRNGDAFTGLAIAEIVATVRTGTTVAVITEAFPVTTADGDGGVYRVTLTPDIVWVAGRNDIGIALTDTATGFNTSILVVAAL